MRQHINPVLCFFLWALASRIAIIVWPLRAHAWQKILCPKLQLVAINHMCVEMVYPMLFWGNSANSKQRHNTLFGSETPGERQSIKLGGLTGLAHNYWPWWELTKQLCRWGDHFLNECRIHLMFRWDNNKEPPSQV